MIARAEEPSQKLVDWLIQIESGGKLNAIGDKKFTNKAYGPLQVRQTVCDDVNRRFKTQYRAEECLGNLDLSVRIFKLYMQMWASKERLGRIPTDEDIARIWNGGPNGWKRNATLAYAAKLRSRSRT